MIYLGHVDWLILVSIFSSQNSYVSQKASLINMPFWSTAEAADSNIIQQEETHVWHVLNESPT